MYKKQTYNSGYFKETRRDLRKNSTPEEILLWERLRNNQLGNRFKRQESIGRFIVDFYSPKNKLAIEIDGEQHKEVVEYDKERTDYLNSLNIKVVRFWNNEINLDIEAVIEKIRSELEP